MSPRPNKWMLTHSLDKTDNIRSEDDLIIACGNLGICVTVNVPLSVFSYQW